MTIRFLVSVTQVVQDA